MYNVMSPKAEEFISDEEIRACLAYAEKNKNNRAVIEQILEKAAKMKGISHKEALVLRLVPAVWNPLVGERIIPPLIGQRFAAKWPYLAAYQSRCERRMVDRFYLFVPMIDRN